MLNFKNILYAIIPLIITMTVSAQIVPINPEIKKALEASGISLDEFQSMMESQDGKDASLPNQAESIENFKVDKEKIRRELEAEIKESIDLDPIVNEIKISADEDLKIDDDIESNDKFSDDSDSFISESTSKKIKEKKSQIIEEVLAKDDKIIQYFGYDIFQRDPEIFQKSISESIDPNYLIGPGDEIVVMLWGETEFNREYLVTRDGYLFIPNIGQVFVNSLTLSKLEKKLFNLMKKVYSSLDPSIGNPTTFFDISLGKLSRRPLRLFALGEIDQPGAYSVKSSTSLFTSLYFFGGPSISGSLRDVRLIRNNKKIASIDFYDYILTGEQLGDKGLQRDDVIFIPPRGKTVRVLGEINRANKYFELKDNEGLKKLIEIAGGLKTETYLKRVQINRIIPPDQRTDININRRLVDTDLEEIIKGQEDFLLYDGDVITFFRINTAKIDQVEILGAVNRPGAYDIGQGLTLLELIHKADSLMGDSYLDRVEIIRTNEDNITKTQIDVDLNKAYSGDPSHNIQLRSNDIIKILSLSELKYKTDVSITGHVLSPGIKLFMDGMDVYDLVFMGGGFENELHLKNTYLSRADLLFKDENGAVTEIIPFQLDSVLAGKGIAKMKIEMGNEIRIYSLDEIFGTRLNAVEIFGNVKRPGSYGISEESKMLDLLFRAGGFQDPLHKESTFFGRADIVRTSKDFETEIIIPVNLAEVLDTTNLVNPSLQPGDKIRVYSKEIFSKKEKIKINGIINNPGIFDLKKNMTLKDLILEAGGIQDNNYRCRVEVARIDPKNFDEQKFSDIITINILNKPELFTADKIKNKLKVERKSLDLLLKDFDVVTIRPDPYFEEQRTLSIEGLVYYPGEYILSSPNDKVTDIIERAGGLRPEANPDASQLIRDGKNIQLSFDRIIRNPRSRLNFNVMENDVIIIGSYSNLVTIEGEVNTPGNYQYLAGKNLSDYIDMAGGFTRDASKFSTFVKYPNGSSSKISLFKLSPKIIDGSIITVVRKEDSVPFSFTEYATNITKIYADLTQAYLLITLAARQ